jgi:PiT family inorganic phosphate transporter
VHWGVVGRIAMAWLFTLPAAALVGGLAAWIASTSTIGLIIVAVLALAGGLGFVFLARRHPVTHDNVNDVDEDDSASRESAPVTIGKA